MAIVEIRQYGRKFMSVQNILDRKGAEVFTVDPTATVRSTESARLRWPRRKL
jgi:hypothetical protein